MTNEQKLKIISDYQSGVRVSQLVKEYGFHWNNHHAILRILKKANVPIRMDNLTHSKRFDIDETYFEKIDSEEKAYFLGFLYADGYNGVNKNTVRINLADTDKEILLRFNELLSYNKPLDFKNKVMSSRKDQYVLNIYNKKNKFRFRKIRNDASKVFNT